MIRMCVRCDPERLELESKFDFFFTNELSFLLRVDGTESAKQRFVTQINKSSVKESFLLRKKK